MVWVIQIFAMGTVDMFIPVIWVYGAREIKGLQHWFHVGFEVLSLGLMAHPYPHPGTARSDP